MYNGLTFKTERTERPKCLKSGRAENRTIFCFGFPNRTLGFQTLTAVDFGQQDPVRFGPNCLKSD